MSLPLSPEMVRGAYEFLRASPPFRRWRLPAAEEIEVRITRQCDRHSELGYSLSGNHHIGVSSQRVGQTVTLIASVAHEMVHLTLALRGAKRWWCHNEEFRRLWRQVCRYHGFDPKAL